MAETFEEWVEAHKQTCEQCRRYLVDEVEYPCDAMVEEWSRRIREGEGEEQ